MLLVAADAPLAAEAAVLLSERGLGGNDTDLEQRLRRWRSERGRRAEAARGLARRWLGLIPRSPFASSEGSSEAGTRSREGASASRQARNGLLDGLEANGNSLGACVALAFPDRVARRRDASGEDWLTAGGRGLRLDPASSLAREDWLAVAETSGSAGAARILSAAPIDLPTIERLFGPRIVQHRALRFDRTSGAVVATRERRLGALRLSGGPDDAPDRAEIAAALVEGVREHGLGLLPWEEGARALQARVAFARAHDPEIPDLSDEGLLADLDLWLPPLVEGRRRLDAIPAGALHEALLDRLGWPGRQALDRIAPSHFRGPAGSAHPIDYAAEGGPAVEVRPQALFGLARHPAVADGRVALVLRLTSPAGRPIQTTRDLPGFWAGSWAAVAREMRGRYPRHPWPDDPASADPTLRAKPRS